MTFFNLSKVKKNFVIIYFTKSVLQKLILNRRFKYVLLRTVYGSLRNDSTAPVVEFMKIIN